jgi:hypothetical protein
MNCNKCINHRIIPGDRHLSCTNYNAIIKLILNTPRRYMMWPFNFDPIWITDCDGYQEKLNASNSRKE